MKPTAACYLRVSTDEQTVENQRAPLEQLCAARGWEPRWFEEVESGAKKDRPQLAAMLEAAHRGEVKAVVVVAVDRLGRDLRHVFNLVLKLNDVGVQVVSHRESWLDTGGPFRDMLLMFVSFIAQWERTTLIERTRAGIARAKRQGKHTGRPRKSPVLVGAAVDYVLNGETLPDAAVRAGVSERTVRRALVAQGARPKPWGRRGEWELPAAGQKG
jgi:DNA invertase Pin-like site-specific DNA recombinase